MQFSTNKAGARISSEQMKIIKDMYPYSASNYKELTSGIKGILSKFPEKKLNRDDQVLALSQHDGCGQIWTIILVNLGDEYGPSEWVLVGHQGHRDNNPLTREQIESDHIIPLRRRYISVTKEERAKLRKKGMIMVCGSAAVLTLTGAAYLSFFGPLKVLEEIGIFSLLLVPLYVTLRYTDTFFDPPRESLASAEKSDWKTGESAVRLAL